MHIFIDESGTFSLTDIKNSVSAVGALVIPDQHVAGFEKLYGRARQELPLKKGEVKGRLLNETQVRNIVGILRKLNCLFEIVAVDSTFQSEEEVARHKAQQAENLTKNLTKEHFSELVGEVWRLREQLEKMPIQLYVQSVAMSELVYNALLNANMYYSFRFPKELGEYHWVIDAKDRNKMTPWEAWWSDVILAFTESKSFRKPFIAVEGGDNRWHEKFRVAPDDYKKQFVHDAENGEWFDVKAILMQDFRFSSSAEYGLEAVDILVNAVRRSMAGNFSREGWLPIRGLMTHRGQHYIQMISLSAEEKKPPEVPYSEVLSDFSTGGRAILPPRYGEELAQMRTAVSDQ